MKIKAETHYFLGNQTFGYLSIAFFIICTITGFFLLVPYDVHKPLESVSGIILFNPWASFVRNIHYWSAQFFLIFFLLHIIEHVSFSSITFRNNGKLIRLILSLPLVFFIMVSGFVLKGDEDSFQALRIIRNLLEVIPVFGSVFSEFLTGQNEDLQILYLNHSAPATLLIFLIIIEHSRVVWGKWSSFLISIPSILLISWALQAPLKDINSLSMKGPWYFTGIQELMHWISSPHYLWIIFFSIPVLLFFRFRFVFGNTFQYKIILISLFFIYFLISGFAFFFRGENWKIILPLNDHYFSEITFPNFVPIDFIQNQHEISHYSKIPLINGRYESCLICHWGISGLSQSHNPEIIGCTACHLGNAFSVSKREAHRNMKLIPGNLSNAKKTCGTNQCHSSITERVENNIMTTLSGMITTNRWVFEEESNLDHISHVQQLGNSASDQHLRNLCSGCHLGNDKTQVGPVGGIMKGGGCNACHLKYDSKSAIIIKSYYSGNTDKQNLPSVHPNLSIQADDETCMNCHNRSGRISTSYEGWAETLNQSGSSDSIRVMDRNRHFKKMKDDVHHKAGMGCIDCHTSYEIMGDGNKYAHKEKQVRIKCDDCHTNNPQFIEWQDIGTEEKRIISLNPNLKNIKSILIGNSNQSAYVNIPKPNEKNDLKLFIKRTGKQLKIKPPKAECQKTGSHRRLECNTCHTAWAPTCLGCHTSYKPNKIGFDHKLNQYVTGTWSEDAGIFNSNPPTLGIKVSNNNEESIGTFIPGMILSIDKQSFAKGKANEIIHERLYAPLAAHTIQRESRSCISCHNNPLAIGFGEGELRFIQQSEKGVWEFESRYEQSPYDGLPLDAWTGFLKTRKGKVSTRIGYRPFNSTEQKRILTVGTCLICHSDKKWETKLLSTDFKVLIDQKSSKCRLPDWQ